MLIMISRLCLVRSKSILVILNSDFGQIVLRKTVITLCSPSFTSRYKVFITLEVQSRVSVIPYWEVDVGKNVFLFLSMALFMAIVSTRLKVSIVTVCAIVFII